MNIFDYLYCAGEDCKITKSEKIHLEKPKCFKWSSRKLGYSNCGIFWWWLKWTKMLHRFRCNDNRTGMNAELPHSSFEFHSRINDFCKLWILIIYTLEFDGFFECFFNRYSWSTRNELGKIIHESKRNSECSTGIFDCCTSCKCSESADLCYVIRAIFSSHISENCITSIIREIHIDIWHAHSRRIQESFEEEPILEWINIRYSRQIGQYCSRGRSSTRSYWYIMSF